MGKSTQWRSPPEREPRPFGRTIELGHGKNRGNGYLSYSERGGPGVVVLHEFFGLQESFADFADALRHDGFTALVPDLYDAAIAGDVTEARAMAQALDRDRVATLLGAAADHLIDNWHPRLGVIGFSLGAGFACELAARRPLDGVVLYYGLGDMSFDAPVIGHFAETDEWTDLDEAREWFEQTALRGNDAELHVYPGTGHWFANSAVLDAYDDAAAGLARERTLEFLHTNLA